MIEISRELLDAIDAQAVRSYPRECCGLLVGRKNDDGAVRVSRIVPSANFAVGANGDGGRDRFEVDPKVRFDLMRELDGSAEAIVGHYHSHPDHPAKPSPTDLDMAFEPEFVWLITSVEAGRPGKTRAWRLNRDTRRVQELKLSVKAPSP